MVVVGGVCENLKERPTTKKHPKTVRSLQLISLEKKKAKIFTEI